MIKRRKICLYAFGVMTFGIIGSFASVPVFSEGPVDISIVEMGDDGSGNLVEEWQDISGAMPGMTYNAVPSIKNDGSIEASVKMCLSESGVDMGGNTIELEEGTFAIDINDEYWTKDTGEDNNGAVRSPIAVCYRYNTELAVGAVTEPLFYEVSLSSELGNEYKNATFNLHLFAEAIEPSEELPDSQPYSGSQADSPDTGAMTNSESLTAAGYISLSAGLVALVFMIVYLLGRSLKKHR